MSGEFAQILSGSNIVFVWIFVAEMIVKCLAFQAAYVDDPINVFDAFITVVGLLDFSLTCLTGDCLSGGGSFGALTALRAFRSLRAFRLVRSWKALRKTLEKVGRSAYKSKEAIMLLFLMILIFALVGIDFFAGSYDEEHFPDGKPRSHFDTLFFASLTVFQAITGTNWNVLLDDSMRVDQGLGVVYFMAVNVVGNYMILNLFLAILLEQFQTHTEDKDDDDHHHHHRHHRHKRHKKGGKHGGSADGEDEDDLQQPPGVALGIVSASNEYRKLAFRVIHENWFDNFILFLYVSLLNLSARDILLTYMCPAVLRSRA